MTPPDRPADHDEGLDREPTEDELAVHAVLDGEATAAQRRRVAGNAALRAQVTEMKAVVDQVASPPKAPGDDVFEAIRAAAASHLGDPEEVVDLRDQVLDPDPDPGPDDEDEDEDEPDPTDPEPHLAAGADAEPADVVVPLDRPARRARRRWPALPAVAAAILVLVALGVGLIVTDGDDPSADFTAVGDSIEGDDSSDGAGGGSGEESSDDAQRELEGSGEVGSAPTTTAPGASAGDASGGATTGSGLVAQASFPDDAALRDVLEEVDPSTLVLDPGPEGFEEARRAANLGRAEATEVARCSAVIQSSDPDIGAAQAAVVVEVDGETLLVLSSPVAATDSAPAAVLLHVLDPVSCVPRFAVQR